MDQAPEGGTGRSFQKGPDRETNASPTSAGRNEDIQSRYSDLVNSYGSLQSEHTNALMKLKEQKDVQRRQLDEIAKLKQEISQKDVHFSAQLKSLTEQNKILQNMIEDIQTKHSSQLQSITDKFIEAEAKNKEMIDTMGSHSKQSAIEDLKYQLQGAQNDCKKLSFCLETEISAHSKTSDDLTKLQNELISINDTAEAENSENKSILNALQTILRCGSKSNIISSAQSLVLAAERNNIHQSAGEDSDVARLTEENAKLNEKINKMEAEERGKELLLSAERPKIESGNELHLKSDVLSRICENLECQTTQSGLLSILKVLFSQLNGPQDDQQEVDETLKSLDEFIVESSQGREAVLAQSNLNGVELLSRNHENLKLISGAVDALSEKVSQLCQRVAQMKPRELQRAAPVSQGSRIPTFFGKASKKPKPQPRFGTSPFRQPL